MPNADVINALLLRTATDFSALAVAWHLALALAASSLMLSVWTPSSRLAAMLLALPLFSVSLASWHTHDVFNGSVFFALSVLTALAGRRLPSTAVEARPRAREQRIEGSPAWAKALGAAVLAYAWFYPHFLAGTSWWHHVLGAPLGVLPCPTLSAVIAVGLLVGGFGSRLWSLVVLVPGLFYGLLGVLRLGVWLDAGLVVAALLLLYLVSFGRASARPTASLEAAGQAAERALIDRFLAVDRLALIGVSTDPAHFSRVVMRALIDAGIDVVPVHPSADFVEGARAFAHIGELTAPVRAALVMTPAHSSELVVEQCAAAGVEWIWLHRGVGTGAVSSGAVAAARGHRLALVAGRCPLMFLGDHVAGVHRAHAALVRLAGHYPKRAGGSLSAPARTTSTPHAPLIEKAR